MDIKRVQAMGQQGQQMAGQAKDKAAGMMGQAQGAAGAVNPNPPIKMEGLIFKKKICTQCNQQLDKTWDACPYCAQAAAAAAAANQKPAKTQAFMLDPSGGGGGMQLLGWIVPIQGPQRGELFALTPATTIGKDPSCTIVLQDGFMSSRHAEIKVEAGTWVLKDLGSTNGTYVNDKRVDKHELVDNDVVTFGKCNVKFKSL